MQRLLIGLCALLSLFGTSAHAKGFTTLLVAFPGYDAAWHHGEGIDAVTSRRDPALHLEKIDPAPDAGRASIVVSRVQGDELAVSVHFPAGTVGAAHVDNIDVNGTLIRRAGNNS